MKLKLILDCAGTSTNINTKHEGRNVKDPADTKALIFGFSHPFSLGSLE
uniref:Uncharacterized protein n=1 Tax=Anopheles albimanus TaxID=7167 RepID=A0A182FXB2_ANOAL